MCTQSLSHVPLFVTPWTIVHQAPLFMEFSRQKYWNGLHFILQDFSKLKIGLAMGIHNTSN